MSRYAPAVPTSDPVSTSVRTVSSTKNGLPPVRSMISGLSSSRLGSAPANASSNSVALASRSGSRRRVRWWSSVSQLCRYSGRWFTSRRMRAPGNCPTRPSSTDWVSASTQWRSSSTTHNGCTRLSRKSVRVTASWVSRRRSEGSSVSQRRDLLHVDVEQGEERREHRPQRVVEGQHLAGDLFAHLPLGIALLDPEVILQEIDDGKVGRRCAIRDGTCLDDEPSAGVVRVDELVDDVIFRRPAHPPARLLDHHLDLPRDRRFRSRALGPRSAIDLGRADT